MDWKHQVCELTRTSNFSLATYRDDSQLQDHQGWPEGQDDRFNHMESRDTNIGRLETQF